MMSKKPTDYDQPVHCYQCGDVITGTVYAERVGFIPLCEECYDEDGDWRDWRSMSVCEYLDECNDRAYDAYVDRCVDEQRDREVFG